MNFEIKGVIHHIGEEKQYSPKFKKSDFVLETEDGNYSQFVKFQLTNDRCDLLDKYKVGQEVTVHFNIQGKPYEKNNETIYFTNLNCWRISSVKNEPQPQEQEKDPNEDYPMNENGNDNLPF